MGIVITCVVYILLVSNLIYFIWEEKNKRTRKKLGFLEVNFNAGGGFSFLSWMISFLFNTLFTINYYIPFLSSSSVHYERDYFIVALIFSSLLIIGCYCSRWKIVIKDNKLVKYGLFTKQSFNISDITEMRQGWFGYKYFINKKRIFSTNVRYHNCSRAFENFIIETSKCKVVPAKKN